MPPPSLAQLQALATKLTPDGIADPPQIAWEMRLRGFTWPQCARAAGYSDAATAQYAATSYVKRAVIESGPARRGEALELADARLTAMIGNWWERGRKDPAAANIVLGAIRDQMKLWRLTEPDAEQAVQRVIVIAGSREEYIAGLQQVVAERERSRSTTPARVIDAPTPGPSAIEG